MPEISFRFCLTDIRIGIFWSFASSVGSVYRKPDLWIFPLPMISFRLRFERGWGRYNYQKSSAQLKDDSYPVSNIVEEKPKHYSMVKEISENQIKPSDQDSITRTKIMGFALNNSDNSSQVTIIIDGHLIKDRFNTYG